MKKLLYILVCFSFVINYAEQNSQSSLSWWMFSPSNVNKPENHKDNHVEEESEKAYQIFRQAYWEYKLGTGSQAECEKAWQALHQACKDDLVKFEAYQDRLKSEIITHRRQQGNKN